MLNFQPYQFDINIRRDRGGYNRDAVYAGSYGFGPDRSWKAEFARLYRDLDVYLRGFDEA